MQYILRSLILLRERGRVGQDGGELEGKVGGVVCDIVVAVMRRYIPLLPKFATSWLMDREIGYKITNKLS